MANPNIFSAYLKPPRSIADYSADLDQADIRRQGMQENALSLAATRMKLDEGQQASQRAAQLRAALAGLAPGATNADRIKTGRALGTPEGYGMADTLEKGDADLRAKNATAGKAEADTAATAAETKYKALAHHEQDLEYVRTPEDIRAWIESGIRKGLVDEAERPRLLQVANGFRSVEEFVASSRKRAIPLVEQAKLEADRWKAQLTANTTLTTNALTNETSRKNNDASNARMAADAAAGRQVTREGQRLTDDRARESNAGGKVPSGYRQNPDGSLSAIPGGPADAATGKPLASGVVKQLTEARDNAMTIEGLQTSFKPEYASKGVLGAGADLSLAAKSVLGTDGDSVEWWKNYRKQAELVERHALFGAALTPTEQASWRSADINPGMHKDVSERNLATRATLARKIADNAQQDQIDAGHNADRINKIAGRGKPGGSPPPAAGNTVKTPDGKTYNFPTPEAAAQFKKAAGL